MKIDMNIANRITVFRVAAIPLFLILLYLGGPWADIAATVVFAAASVSDFLDGYLARKYGLITDFGKILDPVADKIFVMAALVALVELDRLAGWIVIVMLARDFTVGALRDVCACRGVIIAAGIWGKLKTTFQMLAVGMLIFNGVFLGVDWHRAGTFLMYVALLLSLYSGYVYIREYLSAASPDKNNASGDPLNGRR